MEKWFLRNKRGDVSALAEALAGDCLGYREKCTMDTSLGMVLARILLNRGIDTPDKAERYLHGELSTMHDPRLLKDCEKAADILRRKADEGIKIRIIGDYDCDGICAAFILWRILKELGMQVDYCLPHRIKDGYGLNISMVEDAVRDGIDTIITCDNGIAAIEQTAYAKEQGLTVIVTDHHEVPFVEEEGSKRYVLPPADAVVDVKQEGDAYPFKGICGAVTAWKLGQVLLGAEHSVIRELIPYAALATVCDVMELTDENRILVKEGLRILNTCPPAGLDALIRAYELKDKTVSAYHLGFLIGPCLNAAGRLETAEQALKLLTMSDPEKALVSAYELKELNDIRKELTKHNTEKAVTFLEESGRQEDKVIVLYLPEAHESLAGIIAGRIREAFHRPTLVFTKAEEGVKASGRSMECYDMFEHLSACKELFTKFGGHKMAAGLSMADKEDIEVLRKRLNEACSLSEEDFVEKVYIDAALPLSQTSLNLAKALERLEPFGTGNLRPLFAEKDLLLINGRLLGQKGNAARFTVKSTDGTTHQVVLFGDVKRFHDFLDEKYGMGASEKLYRYHCAFPISMIYTLHVNTYQMRESLQIQMRYYC